MIHMILYLFGKANACQPKLGAELRPGVTEISPSNPILPARATSPTTRMSDELIKAAAQGSIVHSWELHVSAVQGCYCLRRRELRKKCPLWMGTTLCSTALRAEFSLYSSPQLEPFAQCTACTTVHGGAANRSLFVSGTEDPSGREFIRKEESARCEWTRE